MGQHVELSKLQNALGKASRLMNMESSGEISKIAKSKRDSINSSLNEEVNVVPQTTNQPMQQPMMQAPIKNGNINSNVPSIIRESFQKNPIDMSILGQGSVLDTIGIKNQNRRNMNEQASSADNSPLDDFVNRGSQPHSMTQESINGGQIDYPMIRTIVEDIVRKYTSSLSKKMLNESSNGRLNELTTFTVGKSFKFLDKQGNIYEATLKKIGNINNKK